MTAVSLHQPPERSAVIRQQLRNVGAALHVPAIALLVGALAIIVTAAISASGDARQLKAPFGFTIMPYDAVLVWLVALIAAASIWQQDEPSRRGYHLAMPVSAGEHTAFRIFAGWVWLMIWVIAYVALLFLLGLTLAGIGGGPLIFRMTWWGWVVPFAAATMTYLLASIALVASERPLAWIVGVPAAVSAMIAIPLAYHAKSTAYAVGRLMQGPFAPTAPFYPLYYAHRTDGLPSVVDWQTGIMATALWTAIALVGVALAVRHRAAGAK